MKSAIKEINKIISGSLLFKFTRRTILFLFLFMLFLILMYIVGNYQLFVDSTQNLIIKTTEFVSIALFVFCITGCIEAAVMGIKHTNKLFYFVIQFIIIFLTGLSGFFSQLIFTSITVFSSGM